MERESEVELSARTLERLQAVFVPGDRADAEIVLARDCARNLPFFDDATPESLERVRFAALKLSEGKLDKLREAVGVAQVDWRDVLVAAGFGDSINAHMEWWPDVG